MVGGLTVQPSEPRFFGPHPIRGKQNLRQRFRYRKFIGECASSGVNKGGMIGSQEKLNYDLLATKASLSQF